MKSIAAPIIHCTITSTGHVLIMTPVILYIMNVRRAEWQAQDLAHGGKRLDFGEQFHLMADKHMTTGRVRQQARAGNSSRDDAPGASVR